MLLFSDSDIVIGGLNLYSNSSLFYRPSVPYLIERTGYCWKLPDPIPRWLYLFSLTESNSPFTWMIGVPITTIVCLLLFLFIGFEYRQFDLYSTAIYFGGLVIGISVPFTKTVRNNSTRSFLFFLLSATFFLTCIYSAFFLKLSISTRYYSRIGSVDEMVEKDFQMISTRQIFVSSISIRYTLSSTNVKLCSPKEDFDHPENVEILPSIDECIGRILNSDGTVFVTSRIHVEGFMLAHKMYCLEHPRSSFGIIVSMFIEREVYIRYRFDEIIQRIVESGIINHWRSLRLPKKHLLIHPKKARNTESFYPVALTFAHLSSGFLIWLTGILLASLAFACEHYIDQKCRSNHLMNKERKFWECGSKIISGDRYYFIMNSNK